MEVRFRVRSLRRPGQKVHRGWSHGCTSWPECPLVRLLAWSTIAAVRRWSNRNATNKSPPYLAMVVVAAVEIVARVHGSHHSLIELQGQYSGILYLNRLASDIAGESADLSDAIT